MPQHTTLRRLVSLGAPVPWPSDDLLCELQSTLRAVADVEFRYEVAREGLELWSGPGSLRP